MRTIDIHAHITPVGFVEASQRGEAWHGMPPDSMSSTGTTPRLTGLPKNAWPT